MTQPPTIKDTVVSVAQAMGLHLTPEQVDEFAAAVESYSRQTVAAGVPPYEAELLAQGFVLGAVSVQARLSSAHPS